MNDDILAIVAALDFLTDRDATPEPPSKWKLSGRIFENDNPFEEAPSR